VRSRRTISNTVFFFSKYLLTIKVLVRAIAAKIGVTRFEEVNEAKIQEQATTIIIIASKIPPVHLSAESYRNRAMLLLSCNLLNLRERKANRNSNI